MIEEYYKSKRTPVYTGYPSRHQPTNLTHYKKDNVLSLPGVSVENYKAPSAFEDARARKLGLSTEEYRDRVSIVSRIQSQCSYQVGDTVWPSRREDYEKYGKCMVVGICRHYDDFGTVEWNKNTPFIVSVRPLLHELRDQTINCTIGWAQKTEPVFPDNNMGDC